MPLTTSNCLVTFHANRMNTHCEHKMNDEAKQTVDEICFEFVNSLATAAELISDKNSGINKENVRQAAQELGYGFLFDNNIE
ncbi:Histone-fold [Hexamita inflata]|uniref:Histone-fold n=1 Tax=Hexamita inflata TaxID=28002 RepID=A0AA86TXM0_9EUKA|nr:Histone-fold [Hexamita inflata]CAI9969681.1 Histone-fold [Hexamita inflata]